MAILVTTGCLQSKKTIDTHQKSANVEAVIKPLVVDRSFDAGSIKQDFTIQSAVLTDSVLSITVSFKGGCGEHDFNIFFNGNYAKSLPPQATLFLKHESIKETCNKDVTEMLKFNISRIKYPNTHSVIVHLPNYSEKLNYKY